MTKDTADCRFCLESDNVNNLIAPCSCKGTFKYVHNKCLMNWYFHQPERARSCSACLDIFETRDNITREEIVISPFMVVKLKSPFIVIIISHCTFFIATNFDISIQLMEINSLKTMDFYIIYQVMNNIFHLFYFFTVVSKIQNKKLYFTHWLTVSRCILLFLHIYLIMTLPITVFLGGVASEYCICLYFYEHLNIVNEINEKEGFQFISREE